MSARVQLTEMFAPFLSGTTLEEAVDDAYALVQRVRAEGLNKVADLWDARSETVTLPRERMDLRYRAAELRQLANSAVPVPDETARHLPGEAPSDLYATVYDALRTFQATAQWSSLQHAQARDYLAEHLVNALRDSTGGAPTSHLKPDECTCMPHQKLGCGHCAMDICEDCHRCPCGCTCAQETPTALTTPVRVLSVDVKAGQLDCCDDDTAHVWVVVTAWSPRRAFLTGAAPFAAAANCPPADLAGRRFFAELDLYNPPGNEDTTAERLEFPGLRLCQPLPPKWQQVTDQGAELDAATDSGFELLVDGSRQLWVEVPAQDGEVYVDRVDAAGQPVTRASAEADHGPLRSLGRIA